MTRGKKVQLEVGLYALAELTVVAAGFKFEGETGFRQEWLDIAGSASVSVTGGSAGFVLQDATLGDAFDVDVWYVRRPADDHPGRRPLTPS